MDIKKKKSKAKKCPRDCSHVFTATDRKSFWVVTAFPTNNRGGPKNVQVPVTIFECGMCGQEKEYPDVWEHNYVLPEKKPETARKPRAVVAKKAVVRTRGTRKAGNA